MIHRFDDMTEGCSDIPADDSLRFSNYLKKAAEERGAWASQHGVFCYRLYDADIPPFAVAIDVYKGASNFTGQTYLVISQYYSSEMDEQQQERLFGEAAQIASRELGVSPEYIFEKARHHDRSGSQYKDGERDSFVIYTQEAGYLFEVDLKGHLDTGIFLDHRPTREYLGEMAQGGRFLNLFAYTGTATAHAAGGGAISTTTVDLSQTYLNWAKHNMELNGFEGESHRFVRSDALHWLDRDIKKGVTYDLIFADPPTFSRSKLKGKKTWNVDRDHVELLSKIAAVLNEGGKAVFSCNLRNFKPDLRALNNAGIILTDITTESIPFDFLQNPKIHQCYLVEKDA